MNTTNKAEHSEVYEDLRDFKNTRESVNQLLQFKRNLSGVDKNDPEQIKARHRAMDAIDNLFAEDVE